MKWVSLHGHTSFSTGDGHGTPEQHVLRAKELGMTSLALTEHGNTSSHVQLEKAALKHGIKPIFGVEAYVAPPQTKNKFHQTILAMNQEGYKQLNAMVTRSWQKENGGFYQKPTVNIEQLLDPKETSGLIVLSGCASSWTSQAITGGKHFGAPLDYHQVKKIVDKFHDVYGDRYYLELQRFYDYDKTMEINESLIWLHEDTGIPLVATADVHYPEFNDWEINQVANAIGWGTTIEKLEEGDRNYSSLPGQTYPESDDDMISSIQKTGVDEPYATQAVMETKKVAERCTVTLPKTDPIRHPDSDGTDEGSARLLDKAIVEGVKMRKQTSPAFAEDWDVRKADYIDRINKELATIQPKGFSDYFLINQEIIGWAKDQGIAVGCARGSAAASLVCYLLRITEINPMTYPDMLFERFLDPGRDDDPDIDTDYQDDRRHEVFEHARSLYGNDSVGNIANFSRFRGKSAMKSVAKALNIPPWEIEPITEFITEAPAGDPREFFTAEDAAEAFPEVSDFVKDHPGMERAFRLEGDMRSLGVHAAGMVISNLPISETCAIYEHEKTNGEKTEVIAYDKRDAAYLNMLKLDCLGLLTMTIIADTLKMSTDGITLESLYSDPLKDDAVYRAFAQDDLTGIFQFEGRATRQIVRDIYSGSDKIPDIMDLADINALSRPGSLSSGMTAKYIKVARGEQEPESIHPVVDDILASTNGCLVYQEQVMHIGKQFGGLDDTEIGRLRKIIGAKQAGGAFEEFWVKFRDGSRELHGVEEKLARQVWDYMAASSTYLFNVAHAISYATLAYWMMKLKIYYPVEFFTASLRSAAKKGKQKGRVDPQLPLLQDAIKHGLTVSPPHPHNSGISWDINEDRTGVIGGFSQLPNIGLTTANNMAAYRAEGNEALAWEEMVGFVKGFGAKSAERAKDFCRRPDPFEINLTNDAVYTVINQLGSGEYGILPPDVNSGSIPDREGDEVVYVGHVIAVKVIDVIGELRQRENLTAEEAVAKLKKPELSTKAKIICSDTGGTEVHVKISRFAYPKLKSEIEAIDTKKTFAVHAVGQANNSFGPSVQAVSLTAIELV